ncbi:MAG TPA: PilT/PilU family type 4a pilus ATPase [Planctomycetota bacterium]|nr:PilT/PilU family type 4a pilus ATPase [Planctomycetota bacterium]
MPDAAPSPIDALLARLAELDGSDLFLTVGAPPMASVSKRMVPLMERPLTRADLEKAAGPFLAAGDRAARFAARPELDIAHVLPGKGRFRLSVFKQRGEVAIVARRVKLEVPTIEQLGLPPVLSRMALERKGLILVTGATGSGKSSTLAAMIDHRNRSSPGHILTIEDPIEFVHEHRASIVSQREVGVDTATFPDALRSALRQAPDVILVGEIRDRETASAALELAETGHLALATLHSVNAAQALDRVANLFPPEVRPAAHMLLSLNLTGIVSQRLVPSRSGGRVAALEVLVPTPRVRDLVRDGDIGAIRDAMSQGGADGMQTFDDSLYRLVKERRLTLEEALPFAESASDLRLRFTREGAGGATGDGIRVAR